MKYMMKEDMRFHLYLIVDRLTSDNGVGALQRRLRKKCPDTLSHSSVNVYAKQRKYIENIDISSGRKCSMEQAFYPCNISMSKSHILPTSMSQH